MTIHCAAGDARRARTIPVVKHTMSDVVCQVVLDALGKRFEFSVKKNDVRRLIERTNQCFQRLVFVGLVRERVFVKPFNFQAELFRKIKSVLDR